MCKDNTILKKSKEHKPKNSKKFESRLLNYCSWFKIQQPMVQGSPNALGIGAASFWSAAEKDIAESPTA